MGTMRTANYKLAAIPYVGITEDAGPNNDSKGRITAMLKAVGCPPGSSWCAAFVSQVFRDCGSNAFPMSGSSQAIKREFDKKALLSEEPNDLLKWSGAVAGWTDENDSMHGHIFLVTERFTDVNGHLTGIGSIEANTGASGQANGDGCYHKRRNLYSDGKFYPVDGSGAKTGPGHFIWFCNTSHLTGGSIW